MRKYRDGGYDALPASVRRRVDELDAPTHWAKWATPYSRPGIFLVVVAFLIGNILGIFAFAQWLPEFVQNQVHLEGRAYKFAIVQSGYAALPGMFGGIILAGALTALFFSMGKHTAASGARVIGLVQEGWFEFPEAERAIQNYILDRTPDQATPDDFLAAFVRQMGWVYFRAARPFLILAAILLYLDVNTYQRLALEGLRTSNYFQIGSTLHPLSSVSHIEAGCRAHMGRDDYHAHLRYVVHFDDGASIDLYKNDLASNYYRLQTIEAYDRLLTQSGMRVLPDHIKPDTLFDPPDMDALCHAEIVRRYKARAHDRARTVLRLPELPEQDLQAKAQTNAN